MPPETVAVHRAFLWLAAGDAVFFLAAWAAGRTAVSVPVAAAVATAVAMPGILALHRAPGTDRASALWRSRGFSLAMGGLMLAAMHVIVPYLAYAEGDSLWSDTAYAGAGVLVGAGGMVAWNGALLRAEAASLPPRLVPALVVIASAGALAAAALAARGVDATMSEWTFRDVDVERVDLTWSPLVAAVPILVWAGAWLAAWRIGGEHQGT